MRRLLLAALLAITAGCGPTEAFKPRNEEKAIGTLKGRLLSSDGTPRSGQLYLLDKKQLVIAKTQVGDDGVFKLDTPLVGMLTLVLNDRHGSGVVSEITMYAAGVNDIGDLTSALLEKTPKILSLTGVGYEERRTQGAGDFFRPAFSNDGLWVYTFRKLSGQTKYELLKVELATGTETVLASALTLDSNTSLQLLNDQVLFFRALSSNNYVTLFLEAQTGTQVFQSSNIGYGTQGQWVRGGQLYVIDAVDQKATVSSLFGQRYRYRYNVAKIDLASKAVMKSALINNGFHDPFLIAQASTDRILVAPSYYCHIPSGQTPPPPADCPAQSDMDTLQLVAVDLPALTVHSVTSFPLTSTFMTSSPPNVTSVLTPDGTTLAVSINTNAGSRLIQVSAANGTQTPIQLPSGLTCALTQARADSQEALLNTTTTVFGPSGVPTQTRGFSALNFATHALTPITANVAIDGTTYSVCNSASYNCGATYLASGGVRFSDYLTAPSRSALLIDVTPTGNSGRIFKLAETDSMTEVVRSPDGTKDIAVVRDTGGFLQLVSGSAGAGFSGMAPLSFINAQHSQPRVSNDGLWVHYFTRDPSSGYQQLFRVALAP